MARMLLIFFCISRRTIKMAAREVAWPISVVQEPQKSQGTAKIHAILQTIYLHQNQLTLQAIQQMVIHRVHLQRAF